MMRARKPKGASNPLPQIRWGFILAGVVHSAGIQDRVGARAVLIRLFHRIPDIRKVFADGGYTGKRIVWTAVLVAAPMEIVKRSEGGKFVVLPKRFDYGHNVEPRPSG
jgi:hypothetical protein